MLIEVKELAATKTGKGKRVTTETGATLFVFDTALEKFLPIGATVDIEIEEKGQYKHIISAKPAGVPAGPPAPKSPQAPVRVPTATSAVPPAEQVRLCCLEQAVKWGEVKVVAGETTLTSDDVLKLATRFELFVTGKLKVGSATSTKSKTDVEPSS